MPAFSLFRSALLTTCSSQVYGEASLVFPLLVAETFAKDFDVAKKARTV